jgi:hypothetical protein
MASSQSSQATAKHKEEAPIIDLAKSWLNLLANISSTRDLYENSLISALLRPSERNPRLVLFIVVTA